MQTQNNNTTLECQWMGADSVRVTCCQPAVAGRSYCADHIWRVYQEGTAVHRRKDRRRADTLSDLISDLNEVYAELIEEGAVSER